MKPYLVLLFSLLITGAAAAQNLTIEGHLFNLAEEPVAGAVVTLNTSDTVQTTTDTNGFFRFSGVGYPTAAELLQQNTALQPGPVNVEVFDLAGRSILQTRARLTSAGIPEGVEPFIALTPGKLYLQQLTDKTGRSVTGKFIATANAGLPGIRAANQNIRSLLKSATDAYNYNITVSSPDSTFRDTTLAVEGFSKEMNSHEAEYFVNEFVRISGNYSAGLDTIINEPVAVFDVRQLFSDDDYQRLGFQISEEYKDVVLVDKNSEKIVLDRTKAPKKGRFGLKAIDPDNNVTDELLVSYNENAIEYTQVMLDEFDNPLTGESVDFSNTSENKVLTVPIGPDGKASFYTSPGEIFTRLPVSEIRNWGLIFNDYVTESKTDTLRAPNNDFNAPLWNELFLRMFKNEYKGSDNERIPWEKPPETFYAFTRDVNGNDVKDLVDIAIADLKERITFTTTKDFYKNMSVTYIDDSPNPTYGNTLQSGVAIYIHDAIPGEAGVSASYINTNEGRKITLGIIGYKTATITNTSRLEKANGQEGKSISEGALGVPSGNFSTQNSSIYHEGSALLKSSSMDDRLDNYAARKQMDASRFIGNDNNGYYINTKLSNNHQFIQKANELKK